MRNKLTIIERKDGSLLVIASVEPGHFEPEQLRSWCVKTQAMLGPNDKVIAVWDFDVVVNTLVQPRISLAGALKTWWRGRGLRQEGEVKG